MILFIGSSIPTFKSIFFHQGLNILLADSRPASTNKQTRNSAGKTSLLEIIHFLFGANCDKDSLFRTDALTEHSFTGAFVIRGRVVTVSRSGKDPSKIFIAEDSLSAIQWPQKTDKNGKTYISNTNWRSYLGHEIFGIPMVAGESSFDQSGAPSFRSLFSYFARRKSSGSFLNPEQHAQQQQRSDWQVNLSYLLGLDWEIPLDFQKVRDRERQLEVLRKAGQDGAFGQTIGSVAELRSQLALAEARSNRLREQLNNFEVLDSYKDLSQRAARARIEMQSLGRELTSINETIQYLESSLSTEAAPAKDSLQQLYTAVGIELPELALRRLDDVKAFYSSIIENRRTHLAGQIQDSRYRRNEIYHRLGALDADRQETLKTLQGRGALEDFVRLQAELASLDASAASLRERFKSAVILEGESTQLDIDRSNLKRRLQADHQERSLYLNVATLMIAETIHELYDDRAGKLVVEATENGPNFKISIEGDRGGGISSMEIFCLDLTLFRITKQRSRNPGFLFHDSHLFDGVDERQIARALLLGQRYTRDDGQYIVTMNSDIFDRLPLPDDIDPEEVVLPTRLSDETETGGLFGFRFD